MARRLLLLLPLALTVALAPGAPATPPAGVSVNPAMARGAARAPVTIVEFSDYQ
jgi:hypothetical protein